MTRSRFATLTRVRAIAVSLALAFAIVASLVGLSRTGSSAVAPERGSRIGAAADLAAEKNDDLILYATIIARVASGENYYAAAADAQRKGGYPLKPFITFRLPTLAVISAASGTTAMTAMLYVLVIATLLAWRQRLADSFDDPGRRISALGLLLSGMVVAFWREFIVLHELWAGILLALAFGLHRADRWLPSVLIAACALFIRELSLPFILLMGAFAVFERHWRETATIAAIIGVFALVMAVHANQVAAIVSPTDPSSPGWALFGGWPSFIRTMLMPGALRVFPSPVGSIFVILSLFGWLSWRSRTGLFGTMMFTGYGILFMAIGRPENFYWGFIVLPTFLLGLCFLPRAFADLRGAAARAPTKLDFEAA